MARTSPNIELRKAPFDSDREHITTLVNDGTSDQEIAKIYKVTPDTIWCRRNRWGLVSGCEIRKAKLQADMSALWINGYSVEEIAEVVGYSLQVIYTKMRLYNIRSLPRLGIRAPNMSLTELRQAVGDGHITEDSVVVVNHNRLPKWVLVPVDQYQDLVNGTFNELRENN